MNRKAKFRAWDSVHNRMIYSDKHLGYMPFDDNCFCNYDFNISKRGAYCFAYDDYNDEITNETDLPIMMWTGLKDKNGVEIYENDIIDIHQTVNGYNQFVIQYDNYKFSARYYNQKTKQILGWYQYNLDELFEINESEKEIEVIGNIYENEVDTNAN